jgi:membrane protease YdiL (CAAX protease family)
MSGWGWFMSVFSKLWDRLPIIVRAIVVGFLVVMAGSIPWIFFVGVNLRLSPSVPWAFLVMGVWLYFYLKYFAGTGWPATTKEVRQVRFRHRALSPRVWALSLWAGGLGAASLIALQITALRMVRVPVEHPTSRSIPLYSLLPLAVMSAFAAGIPEEVGFRGYMQVPIERRHGPVVAILLVAFVFGLSHLTHGLSILTLFDFAYGVVYGVVAFCADSLLPTMVLHCGLDIILFVAGRHITAALAAKTLIWSGGADVSFWSYCAAFILFGVCSLYAFKKLNAFTSGLPQARSHNPRT